MSDRVFTCDACDALLPEWLDDAGALARADRDAMDAHVATCLRCAGLVRDLRAIESDARALPELRPSRDLWDGIAARIEAPVVPLATRRAEPRPRRTRYAWMSAAAAALVVMTAGVTYVATKASVERRALSAEGTSRVANVPTPVAAPGTPSPAATTAAPESTTASPTAVASKNGERSSATAQPSARETRLAYGTPRPTEARSALSAQRSSLDAPYDREIAKLRALLARRRGEMDSTTVLILERNLRIIDEAIAQSRAALKRDPASTFLYDQLNDALDKKLELLRTAALLPSRTS